MRRFDIRSGFSFLLLLGLVLQHNEVQAAQCACATTDLNVRSRPTTRATILHTLQSGECLPYRGDSQWGDGYRWQHVTYNGQSAWSASNWLNIRPCAEPDQSAPAGCPRIVTRAEWGARSPSSYIGNMPALPIYVFIHHGASGDCSTPDRCSRIVRAYQNYHMDNNDWPDIGYNFLVGEDGRVYEGRGWSQIGTHTRNYNSNGIGNELFSFGRLAVETICFIGNFQSRTPNAAALNAAKQLIRCGLDIHKIHPGYTLKGHRDVGQTNCPGSAVILVVQGQIQLPGCPRIITREEWGARNPPNPTGERASVPTLIVLHHSGERECTTQVDCSSIVRSFQDLHMDVHGWSDIGYSFMVGEDGNVYEGRGWNHIAVAIPGIATNPLSICIMGDFTSRVPNDSALNAVKQLISCAASNYKIAPSYSLKGHRDVSQTDCPGKALYDVLQTWPHYAPATTMVG